MANFNEQVLEAWDEWEASTGAEANNPDDFVAWALENKKLVPYMSDIRKLLRKQVTSALRQAIRIDEAGFSYRAKQCVLIEEDGLQLRMWFDTDKGGTALMRQKANRQRRDAVASDVYRAVCDAEHMTKQFPDEPPLLFPKDFTDDCAEKRAVELLERDKDKKGDKAA